MQAVSDTPHPSHARHPHPPSELLSRHSNTTPCHSSDILAVGSALRPLGYPFVFYSIRCCLPLVALHLFPSFPPVAASAPAHFSSSRITTPSRLCHDNFLPHRSNLSNQTIMFILKNKVLTAVLLACATRPARGGETGRRRRRRFPPVWTSNTVLTTTTSIVTETQTVPPRFVCGNE